MSVIVEGADERNPIVRIWRFPASHVCRAQYFVIITNQLLTTHHIIQRDLGRISQHVIQHHESSRPASACLTMEMRPAILRKCAYSEDKSIDFFVQRTRVIRNRQTYIGSTISINKVALRTRVLDRHILPRAWDGARFLDRSPGTNNNFATGLERFHARSLICLDLIMSATDVGPIIRSKPANAQTVDEYVRLLSQVEDRHRTARASQQKLETISRKLAAARSMKIGQAGV